MAKARSKRCPGCGKRFRFASVGAHAWYPFCSERCKTIDLAKWVEGRYAIVEDLSMGHDLKAGGLELDEPDDQ